MYTTLYSNMSGKLIGEPALSFLGRSGLQWLEAEEGDLIPLPEGSSLTMMPGHFPVGINAQGSAEIRETTRVGKPIWAAGCLLPQGFTRTLLPATVSPINVGEIPMLGYTAVGEKKESVYAAAIKTDDNEKWNPSNYNPPELSKMVQERLAQLPENRILRQLAHCSLNYSCFTAQNVFMSRWEGGIPTTSTCNANCMGCISESHGQAASPQDRLNFIPAVHEITEIGLAHLQNAEAGIISFGQGCEGDPCTNPELISEAIRLMRAGTDRGSINCNTNAGNRLGMVRMIDAGLDMIRVTMLSAVERDYLAYHRPRNYHFKDVLDSIAYAQKEGVFVSLNLLTMPGFTDSVEQLEGLLSLVRQTGLPMVQLRNLNIDPNRFFHEVPPRSEALGVKGMIDELDRAGIKVASFSHPARKGLGLV